MRRENLSKEERRRIMKEDEREERELRAYMAQAIATEINNLLPGTNATSNTPSDEHKTPVAVQDGTAEWLHTRPEGGMGQSGPDRSRGGR